MSKNTPITFTPELQAAAGKVPYTLMNDYLFHIVFQKSLLAQKGLVSSLLRIKAADIHSIHVINPILPGTLIRQKEFLLDILLSLNNSSTISLEMQIRNWKDWPERSLSYICRLFSDNLKKGESYKSIRPIIQAAFTDFALFPDYPEFFSTYQFAHTKNHYIFSDKLKLLVVNLKQTKLADEEDKLWGLDKWTRLFKAATWEEIKMIAANNEALTDAANTMHSSLQDFLVRENCIRREWYEQDEREKKRLLDELQHTLDEQQCTLNEQQRTLDERQNTIMAQQGAIADKDFQLAKLRKLLDEHGIQY